MKPADVTYSPEKLSEFYEAPRQSWCWTWIGSRVKGGYGFVRHYGAVDGVTRTRGEQAHRAVYKAHGGIIPPGYHLHHKCRNRLCVNPAHMVPVSPQEHAQLDKEARRDEVAELRFRVFDLEAVA